MNLGNELDWTHQLTSRIFIHQESINRHSDLDGSSTCTGHMVARKL